MKLSRGMAIGAVIEARLLGRRLLTLNADITVLPAEDHYGEPVGRGEAAIIDGNGHRQNGDGLLEAARLLDAGARDLEEARRQMQ